MDDSLFERLKSLPTNDRIEQSRLWREEMIRVLNEKIAQLRSEREAIDAQYLEEIAGLESELFAFGIGQRTEPTDVGVKAYNFLREHPGERFLAGRLLASIRCVGAAAHVALNPFIENGRVKCEGERKGRVYWVDE